MAPGMVPNLLLPMLLSFQMDAMLRRLIRFCKNLTTSGILKRKTLINLVKGMHFHSHSYHRHIHSRFSACCPELVLFHSTLCYSLESDGWYDKGPNIRPISGALELQIIKGGVYDGHIK